MSTAKPHRREELHILLRAGASGSLNDMAAVHLLTFLPELTGSPVFQRRHIRLKATWAPESVTVLVARVRDWDALASDNDLGLTDTELRFLKIAASFAGGRPVDLSATLISGLGQAAAQRAAEAVLIATNTAWLLKVSDTQQLTARKAFHKSLSGGRND